MRTTLHLASPARGQIIAMLAFLMVMFLGAAGFAVHLSLYFFEKTYLQNVVKEGAGSERRPAPETAPQPRSGPHQEVPEIQIAHHSST